MAEKLPRVLQNIFGENAMNGNKIAQFGSVIAGAPLYTGDIAQIQALQYWQNGWVGATFSDKRYPTSEETTGINKVVTQQLKYLFQQGIPEWHIDEVYYKNSYCQVNGAVFLSLTDDNIGHNPVGDSVNWIEALKAKEQDLSISNALSTGEVKNESKLYEQILRRAHSTFDLSKFEVVGSPVITDDGIASGFAASSYLTCSLSVEGTNLLIRAKFLYNADNTGDVYTGSAPNESPRIICGDAAYLRFYYYDNTIISQINCPKTNLVSGKWYYTEYFISSTNQYAKVYDENMNLIWSDSSETTVTLNLETTLETFRFGWHSADNYLQSELDLKYCSITADGIPIFSGSQTGIDTIKPDDYEVVGEPTITEDGILNITNKTNYVSFSIPPLGDNYEIQFPVYFNVRYTGSLNNILITSGNEFGFAYSWGGNWYVTLNATDGTNIINASSYLSNNYNIGQQYLLKLKCTYANSIYTYTFQLLSNNEVLKELTVTSENRSAISEGSSNITYQTLLSVVNEFTNIDIDLNKIRFYSNGNLVYQPCLKIPYTLSKTGSKIVDVAYRDRVQDVYEQYGTAMYYTLDEENKNFTLPMSDIYGMITKNRELAEHANLATQKAYIVETYKNGRSGYRIWSDGYCEQWGNPNSGGANQTITLLKAYKNLDYNILATSQSQDNNSAQVGGIVISDSSFNLYNGASTTSYWQTKGYITEG